MWPPREIRENRIILRQRTGLVQNRTAVVNRIRSLLDKYDLKHTYDRIHGTTGIRWLKEISLESASYNISLQQYMRHIEFLNYEIKGLERQITSDAAKKEYVAILMSMTGIDYYYAMLITSEIGEISTFQTPKKLVSWAGLCPTLYQSGGSLYHGKIKKGNKKIQPIMTQAANTASRTDERMKQFYVRIAKKHGHNIAITHVANKMMTIIWYMLTETTLYNERKESLYQENLKRINSKYCIS